MASEKRPWKLKFTDLAIGLKYLKTSSFNCQKTVAKSINVKNAKMKIDKLPAENFNIESSKTNGEISEKKNKASGDSAEVVNGNGTTEDAHLEESTASLNGNDDDTPVTNGKPMDDPTSSPVDSPSAYQHLELEDELLSDEITLRLTDDEEPPENYQNEQQKSPVVNHDLPLANSDIDNDSHPNVENNDDKADDDKKQDGIDDQEPKSSETKPDESNPTEESNSSLKDTKEIEVSEKSDEKIELDDEDKNLVEKAEKDESSKTNEIETAETNEPDTDTKDAEESVQNETIVSEPLEDKETEEVSKAELVAEDVPENTDASKNDSEPAPQQISTDVDILCDDILESKDYQTESNTESCTDENITANDESLEKTVSDLQKEIEKADEDQESIPLTENSLKRRLSSSSDDCLEKKIRSESNDEMPSPGDLLEVRNVEESSENPTEVTAEAKSTCESPTEAENATNSAETASTDLLEMISPPSAQSSEATDSELPVETDDTSEKLAEENKTSTSLKRAHDEDDNDVDVKKPKMFEGLSVKPKVFENFVTFENVRQFISKKLTGKISPTDLEELCLQKFCECVNHSSRIGALHMQLKRQEQMIETWRNKYTFLCKQVRDLEVVHHRMLQEVRAKFRDGGRMQDFCPVKITRSVGLQVSLSQLQPRPRFPSDPPVNVNTMKRKIQRNSLPTKMPTSPASSSSAVKPATSPAVVNKPSQTATKTVPTPPVKGIKTILPKVLSGSEVKESTSTASNSLLGSYLQGNAKQSSTLQPAASVASPTSVTTSTQASATITRKPNSDTAKVIDLTDEDDVSKASAVIAAPAQATVTVTASASTPAPVPSSTGNIRVMAPHQLNTAAASTSASMVTTSPRVAYLVQTPVQQPLLIAANAPANRPNNVRPTVMFKQMPQGQNQSVPQRFNIVRPASTSASMSPVNTTNTQQARTSQSLRLASTSSTQTVSRSNVSSSRYPAPKHPAPLPLTPTDQPHQPRWKSIPPKPSLKISRVREGIILSWKIINKDLSTCEEIASYQLYAYQETNAPPSTDMWRKVGDVKALALPMACTLTQFTDGNKYYFAVRAVDVKSRVGPFSQPEQISLP